MTNGILEIQGDAYWEKNQVSATRLYRGMATAGDCGIYLDAPSELSVHGRSWLPAYVVYLRTMAETRQIDPEASLLLVAVRHEDNALYAGRALQFDEDPATDDPPTGATPDTGFKGQLFCADVREQLGLPWERGTVSLSAMLRERVSNERVITFGHESTDFVDSEVESYVETRDRSWAPLAIEPVWPPLDQIRGAISRVLDGGPAPFPNYRPQPESPPLPTGAGINLLADRVSESGSGPCVMRGSFRLPCTSHERVPFNPETGRPIDVGAPGATAVVGIHLVGTGTRSAGPIVLSLRVPSFDPVEPGDEAFVTGFFSIDLFQLGPMQAMPDTYFFTAFSREVRTGPVTIGVAPMAPR